MSFISQPIFSIGAERSGTTLLRLMLDSHSQLSWCYEFEYAVDLISDEGSSSLKDRYKWLATHRIFQATNMEKRLRLQCWSKRLQFRMKQLGLSLFIADYLSRRLKIDSWQTKTQLRINAIVQSQLK